MKITMLLGHIFYTRIHLHRQMKTPVGCFDLISIIIGASLPPRCSRSNYAASSIVVRPQVGRPYSGLGRHTECNTSGCVDLSSHTRLQFLPGSTIYTFFVGCELLVVMSQPVERVSLRDVINKRSVKLVALFVKRADIGGDIAGFISA